MTTFNQRIRKILSKYIYYDPIEHVDTDDEKNDRYTKEMIDTVLSSIQAEVRKVIPPKEKICNGVEKVEEQLRLVGYNQAIADCLKRLEG